ncbi:MAG: WecB/TagA/CpsF family glycosyltransferase [Chitinophagaceae bacterium]|nr:WecB/TagA/CpsF family glycosyltransferase [Chitinophagaceae bacterium]
MDTKVWNIILKKITDFEVRGGLTSFVNPYSMLLLQNQKEIAEQIDYWHVDGISLVNELNKSFKKCIQRFSFDDTSVAPLVFQFAKTNKLSIIIVGTKEELIHSAIKNIEKKYSVAIAYYRNGFFSDEDERRSCMDDIIAVGGGIVICGMGTPYQEQFLIDLRKKGWNGYGYTCGGYLHQIAQKENYYPRIFDKLNIRWVYRIIDEPKLFRRYFLDYPNFFFRFFLYKKQFNKE